MDLVKRSQAAALWERRQNIGKAKGDNVIRLMLIGLRLSLFARHGVSACALRVRLKQVRRPAKGAQWMAPPMRMTTTSTTVLGQARLVRLPDGLRSSPTRKHVRLGTESEVSGRRPATRVNVWWYAKPRVMQNPSVTQSGQRMQLHVVVISSELAGATSIGGLITRSRW